MYINLTSAQVTVWQGKKSGVNVFNARQTVTGQWVVDQNSINEFPQAFTGSEVMVNLSITDFPQVKTV
jgi:hypothetical protein